MTQETLGEVTPVEAELPESQDAPVQEGVTDEPEAAKPAEDKAVKGVQKRIDELTWAREEANRRAQALEQHNQQMQMQYEQLQRQLQAVQRVQGLPDPNQFVDPTQYAEAVRQHIAQNEVQSLQQMQHEMARRQQAMAQAQYAQAEMQQVAQVVNTGQTKYADFQQVVNQPGLPDLTQVDPMFKQALFRMPEAADIVYYLGKNPQEANRLMSMSVPEATAHLGTLKAQISAQPKKPSQQPIPNVGGSGGFKPGLADDLPVDEWMRRRNAQVRKRN